MQAHTSTTYHMWSHPVDDDVGCLLHLGWSQAFPTPPLFSLTHPPTAAAAAVAAAAMCFVSPDDFPVKSFVGTRLLVLARGDRTAVLLISG